MYNLSEPAPVTIQVLDAQGQLIRSFPAEFNVAGYHTRDWDTTKDSGETIISGEYNLKISAVDKFNNSGSAEVKFSAGIIPETGDI